MPIRCVIFDLDQTVAKTAGSLYASFNAGLAATGHAEMTVDEIVALFGPPEWMALKATVGEEAYAAAFDAYLKHYVSMLPGVRVYAGIAELLRACGGGGIFRGMITGKGRATTEVTLLHLGIRELFDFVLTGDEISEPKPCAEGIQRILRRCGAAKNETIMIGDLPADIGAAKAAGVIGGAALWDSEWPEKLLAAMPDVKFEAVDQLRKYITATEEHR